MNIIVLHQQSWRLVRVVNCAFASTAEESVLFTAHVLADGR